MAEQLLSPEKFAARLDMSLSSLNRKIQAGELPRPLVVGKKMRRFKESTADEYINSLEIDNTPIPVAPGVKRGRKKKMIGAHDENN